MNTKGHSYPKSIILQTAYFKLRFALSYQDVEEIMKMRGVHVDHPTISVGFISLHLSLSRRSRRERVEDASWRLDETYNCKPRAINIDKSGTNTAAIKVCKKR